MQLFHLGQVPQLASVQVWQVQGAVYLQKIGNVKPLKQKKEGGACAAESRSSFHSRLGTFSRTQKLHMLEGCKASAINFLDACAGGDVDKAEALYPYIPAYVLSTAFARACGNGRIEVCTWLFQLGGVDVHACEDSAFRSACRSGHLHVATWLFGLGGVDVHMWKDEAFRGACRNGQLGVAKWLVGLGGVDIHAHMDDAFQIACYSAHLGLGERLVGVGGVDMHVRNGPILQSACRHRHAQVGRWLLGLDPGYAWPPDLVAKLCHWSDPRDAWLNGVARKMGGGG